MIKIALFPWFCSFSPEWKHDQGRDLTTSSTGCPPKVLNHVCYLMSSEGIFVARGIFKRTALRFCFPVNAGIRAFFSLFCLCGDSEYLKLYDASLCSLARILPEADG